MTLRFKSHEWFSDVYMITSGFNSLARKSCENIEKSMINCVLRGLSSSLIDSGLGDLQQIYDLGVDFFKSYFYMMRHESTLRHYFNDKKSSYRSAKFINLVIRLIFEDDFYFEIFKDHLKDDQLMSIYPINQDEPKQFSTTYYNLMKAFGSIKSKSFMDLKKLNSYEREIRRLDSKGMESFNSETCKHRNLEDFVVSLPTTIKVKEKIFHLEHKEMDENLPLSHPNFKHCFKLEKEDSLKTWRIAEQSFSELLDFLKELKETKKMKLIDQNGSKNIIPVFKMLGSALIGEVKSCNKSFIMMCSSIPSDVNIYRESVKIYFSPIIFNGCKVANNLHFLISYNLEIPFSKIFSIPPMKNILEEHENDLQYIHKDKKFVDYSEVRKISGKTDTQKVKHTLHDCGNEYKKVDENPEYLTCFRNYYLEELGYENNDDFQKVMRRMKNEKFDEKDSILRMRDLELMNGIVEISKEKENKSGSDKSKTIEEFLANLDEKTLEKIISSGNESINEMLSSLSSLNENVFERRKNKFQIMYRQNTFSPIDKTSFLYKNLSTFFSHKTDKFINVNFSLTFKDKNKLLRSLESQRLLYNDMYDKFLISQDDIRKVRIFIAWMKKMIKDSSGVKEDSDDFNVLENLIKKLDEELIGNVDMEKYDSSSGDEFDYI